MLIVREPAFRRRAAAQPVERTYRLPVDAYETEDSIVLTASVPGVRPEDVEITLDGDTLIIRGQINGLVSDAKYLLRERFHGAFERRLAVNIPVNIETAEASFADGVLKLVLPKAQEARPQRIAVKTVQ